MADTQLIALDWGTTSLRAYRLEGAGRVAESRQLTAGILHVTPVGAAGFAAALDQACGDWMRAAPASPLIACGMIGSAQGWCEAAYFGVPASIDDLGRALTQVATPGGAVLHIIPGLIARGALPDVMRGEETQVAGVIAGGDLPDGPGETWIVLPGTHSKWVRIRDRRIVQFRTFMTGEVFAAMCEHTILGRTMRPGAEDPAAFDRGAAVARSDERRGGILSTMFSTRTLGLVGALAAEAQRDYLSGLLIGHEIAALVDLGESLSRIVLVGDAALCRRYQRALPAFGAPAPTIASAATERGLWHIAGTAGLVPRSAAC